MINIIFDSVLIFTKLLIVVVVGYILSTTGQSLDSWLAVFHTIAQLFFIQYDVIRLFNNTWDYISPDFFKEMYK